MASISIITLTDAKTWLRYPNPASASSDDAGIQSVIDAAADVLRYLCDDILPTQYSETHSGGTPILQTYHKPILSVSSVIENAGALSYALTFQPISAPEIAEGGVVTEPEASWPWSYAIDDNEQGLISKRGVANSLGTFQPGYRNISITYIAGRSPVPPALVLAAKDLVAHVWQQSELRSAVTNPAFQQYDAISGAGYSREPNTVLLSYGIPNRILELVAPYRRDVVFA